MANQETQMLDDMISKGRRKMLGAGLTSLAGMVAGALTPSAQAAAFTDADILNFALNLEYLEANFYYLAAFGTTIDVATAASTAAGAPLIKLTGTVGTAGTVSGGSQVPFSTIEVSSYAIETAIEEGKHVQTLLTALGSSAVAQPAINLGTSFQTLATAANIPNGSAFSPYASDENFLVGAYVFEDVGVTAYHGAAQYLTVKANLQTAAGILAVEGYHAGLIRTTINYLDPTGATIAGYTNLISTLRATLSQAGLLGAAPGPYDANPDDYGLATFSVTLGANATTATRITDADPVNEIAFARNTTQVLNIVTGGGAVNGTAVVKPAVGVFFPAGMNAGPNGFN
jgi:Ferritin-like domain